MGVCKTVINSILSCFCLFGICESISNEYWLLEEEFYQLGCSLRPGGILKKSVFLATLFSTVLSVITLVTVLIVEGLSKPGLFLGVAWNLAQIWAFIFVSIWITHILWIVAFIFGRKIARVELLKGVIEKIWKGPVFELNSAFESEKDEGRDKNEMDRNSYLQSQGPPDSGENLRQTSTTRKLN